MTHALQAMQYMAAYVGVLSSYSLPTNIPLFQYGCLTLYSLGAGASGVGRVLLLKQRLADAGGDKYAQAGVTKSLHPA